MPRSLSSYLRLILLLGDLLIINLLIVAIFDSVSDFKPLAYTLVIFNGLWLGLSFLINPYKFSRICPFSKLIRIHFSFLLTHFLAVTSALFIISYENNSLLIQLLQVYGWSVVLLLIWRAVYFYVSKNLLNRKLNYRNVVIVGFGDLALEMRNFFRFHPEHGFRFMGYFDQKIENGDVNHLGKLEEFCTQHGVDEIYCCLPYLPNDKVKSIVDYGLLNLIKVKLITDYRGFLGRGLHLERYDDIPVLNVAAIPLDERRNQVIKRIFDIAFSGLFILLVMSWLTPIIALLIKLNSKGPVFFKQQRAGKGNKPFTCLKFRTMYVHDSEFIQATKEDPRITLIGKFLRKTSLDEFPQFLNVLKGDMSIIGPRPHPFKLNEQFYPRIEKFMARQYIKPGITGLAQAKGFRGETRDDFSMKGRVKLDRFYIENWSFLLDLKIIVATIISLTKGDQQAY